jgi:hypothetical protein
LHAKIQEMPFGVNREEGIREAEQALSITLTIELGRVCCGDRGGKRQRGPEATAPRRGMFGPQVWRRRLRPFVKPVAMPGSSPRPYGGYFDEVVDTSPVRW